MQRRVLLVGGAALIAVVAIVSFRSMGRREAGHALDHSMDQVIATLPPGYTATHGATEVNPLTGTLTVHDLALSLGGKKLWTAETVTVSGADRQALTDVFDPAAYKDGRPAWTAKRLLIADATANGVVFPHANKDADVRIKSVTLHQLSGRPFDAAPTPAVVDTRAFRADAALAFAIQSLELHNLALVRNPPATGTLTLASAVLRDYDGGLIGKAALQNFTLDAPGAKPGDTSVHATLDTIEMKHVDASGALQAIRNQDHPGAVSFTPTPGAVIRVAGLLADVAPGPHITVQEFQAHASAALPQGASGGEGSLHGLTIALKDTPLAPGPAAALAAFGMREFTLDITGKSTTNPALQNSELAEDVVLKDLGTLHLAFGLRPAEPGTPDQDPKAALLSAPITHATITWQDASLVNRVLAAAAVQMNTTPDAVRAQLALPLLTLGFLMPDQPDAADQITHFLNNPGTITATLAPPSPISLAAVSKAPTEQQAHLLGARVEAK